MTYTLKVSDQSKLGKYQVPSEHSPNKTLEDLRKLSRQGGKFGEMAITKRLSNLKGNNL